METTILVLYLIESYNGGRSSFPGLVVHNVQSNCPTLVATTQATTPTNRTVLFQCPGSGQSSYALRTTRWIPSMGFSFEPTHFYAVWGATPSFTLPRGYLSIALTNGAWGCPTSQGTFSVPLESGVEVAIGGESYIFDYCAVIDSSVSKIDSFTVDWSPGTPPIVRPAPFKLAATPITETVPFGGTANYSITVTSLGGWTGNVTIILRGGYTLGISYQMSPPTVFLKPGGSNVTTLRQPTCTGNSAYCAPLGLHTIIVDAYTGCVLGGSVFSQGICLDSYDTAGLSLNVNIT
jgi:hypothetical protein